MRQIIKLPDFAKIWKEDRVALIDPDTRVCIGVSRRIAENLDKVEIQEKIYPIWKQQVELQKRIEEQREKINTAYLLVTRQCNMNCDFCAINANRKMHLEKEFKIDDIKKKVVPFFQECCPHKLIVTGGEPLIKDKIIEMVKILRDGLRCPITLQSNGLTIDEEMVGGLEGNITEIDFSTKHMFETHKKENQLRDHIEMCQEAGIHVVLTFIYDKKNKSDLYKIIDIAAEYNTRLLINIVAPVGKAKENQELLTNEDSIEMNLDIARYIYENGYEEKPLFELTEQMIQVKTSCGGYGKVMAIFPEGDIYMCQCLEEESYRVGNILEESPGQIDSKMEEMLEKEVIKSTFCVDKKPICNTCDYRYLCTGKCQASPNQDDYTCYYIKGVLDYQLFYKKQNSSHKEALIDYISFLEKLLTNIQKK